MRDADWIRRHIGAHEHALLTDASPLWSLLGVMGPRAGELLARLSPDDLSPAALPVSHTKVLRGRPEPRSLRGSFSKGS